MRKVWPLAEHFADRGQWPPSLQALKLDTSGKFTRDIVISKGAGGKGEIELTATMRSEGVDRRVAGKSVTLASKDGGQTWLCRPGTINVSHVPHACRPEGK